jgi:hypothetical protein
MGDVNCYGTATIPKNPFVADKKGGMQSHARGRRNFTLLLPFSR